MPSSDCCLRAAVKRQEKRQIGNVDDVIRRWVESNEADQWQWVGGRCRGRNCCPPEWLQEWLTSHESKGKGNGKGKSKDNGKDYGNDSTPARSRSPPPSASEKAEITKKALNVVSNIARIRDERDSGKGGFDNDSSVEKGIGKSGNDDGKGKSGFDENGHGGSSSSTCRSLPDPPWGSYRAPGVWLTIKPVPVGLDPMCLQPFCVQLVEWHKSGGAGPMPTAPAEWNAAVVEYADWFTVQMLRELGIPDVTL